MCKQSFTLQFNEGNEPSPVIPIKLDKLKWGYDQLGIEPNNPTKYERNPFGGVRGVCPRSETIVINARKQSGP